MDNRRCGCIGTPSRSTGTAAGRNRKSRMGRRFCGGPNSPAIRATPRLGARCTATRTAHCRGRAAGSPTCTSSWHRPSWAMTPRSTPVLARWRNWRNEGRYPSGSYLPALARGFAAFERGGFFRGDRGARSARRGKRTHWRQPRAARPDRVHVVEGLSQRRSAGGSAASAECAEAGRFRHSGHGGCGGALTGRSAMVA